ncbi:ATP-binding protein [Tardiphaga robiniae]|uniref:Histidine kinase/HSP90-like ATPase domain-containing protein n=1 Tax=Tardiphaga robiniae TaxID=943830 RepID=A0A7G6U1B5_9BRAD|nr:ATP-binding protein [Tardiphaga robiniae]QND72797.1 hypothetical protein HB776_17320 [Tardiphaga robiniae]
MGLSIVRRIVDRYDGTIDLDSVDGNAGRGLTVRVTLPLADRRSGTADQR